MTAWGLVIISLSLGVTCWSLPFQELSSCKDGSKLPIPEECKQYLQCVKSNWEVKSCPWFQKFDYVSLSCKFTGASCAPMPTTPSDSSTVKPTCDTNGEKKPIDCFNYQECVNNQWENKACPTGSEFDEESLKCVFYGAKCKTTASPGTTSSTSTTSAGPSCKPPQKMTVPNICNKYFECTPVGNTDQWVESYCPANKIFQSSSCECVYSWMATCETTLKYCPTTLPQSSDSTSSLSEKCINSDKVGVPKDCHKYEECIDGVFVPKSCGMFKRYFDTKSKTCVMFGAKCEPDDPIKPTCDTNGEKKPIDCFNYQECVNNQWENKACPTGSEFDEESLKCVFYGAKCKTTASPGKHK